MVICLVRCADLHMAQLMPLPLTVSCFSKIQIGSYLSGVCVCGKITVADAQTIHLDATASGLPVPHFHHPPFLRQMPFLLHPPIYPGLGHAPNNAGLHTWQLVRNPPVYVHYSPSTNNTHTRLPALFPGLPR